MISKFPGLKMFVFLLAMTCSPVVAISKGPEGEERRLTLHSDKHNKNRRAFSSSSSMTSTYDHPTRMTLSSTLPSMLSSPHTFHQNKGEKRDLQSARCVSAIATLFDENPALSQAETDLSSATDSLGDQCTQNPCVVNENVDIDEAIVAAHRDACIAAGGTIYEYDFYRTCTNSTGGYLEDQFLNIDYCFPSSRDCRPVEIDVRLNAGWAQSADNTEAIWADYNYVCDQLDVDFVRSENFFQSKCNDNTKTLFDANPSLVAAADVLSDNFWDAYSNCTDIETNCVTDEDELEGAKEYVDECVAAGGRIWEYNMYVGCTNDKTNAVKNETILGFDFCYAWEGCPTTVAGPFANQQLRYFAEDLSDFLGSDWTCSHRRLEGPFLTPGLGSPPSTNGNPTSTSPTTADRSPGSTPSPSSSSSWAELTAYSFFVTAAITIVAF